MSEDEKSVIEVTPPAPSVQEDFPPRVDSVIFSSSSIRNQGLTEMDKFRINDGNGEAAGGSKEDARVNSLCDVDLADDQAGATTTDTAVGKTSLQKANMKLKVDNLHNDTQANMRESHDTVQIRKTIYSAAALDSQFWPTAFLTFSLQVIIICLYCASDFRPFDVLAMTGGYWAEIELVLGRFVSYFLIWTCSLADLQNAVNLLFCTTGTDRILGGFQFVVVTLYPFAWVCAIQSSTDYKQALTSTGILAMFLKLDETVSSILDLGLLKREIGQLVHTIKNPLPAGHRETIMNTTLMIYTCLSFCYVWIVALNCHWFAVILWLGFTLFFFRAFYLDMKSAKSIKEIMKSVIEFKHMLTGDEITEKDVDASDEGTTNRRQFKWL
jgi:hypothetical protein